LLLERSEERRQPQTKPEAMRREGAKGGHFFAFVYSSFAAALQPVGVYSPGSNEALAVISALHIAFD
jgi:hypothetical protein